MNTHAGFVSSWRMTAACLLLAGCAWFADAPPAIAAAHQLSYHGGPLVSNADVVMVDWNGSVPEDVQSTLPGFYEDILRSDYWTVLLEYATSSQTVGFGAFDRAVVLTPGKCAGATNCTVDDTDIQAELGSDIDGGQLPAPTMDAGGRSNTVYMMHFPPNVTVTLQGSSSCVQFCSYNWSFIHDSKLVIYGVIPDQSAGCFNGCATTVSTHIDKETALSVAELANAATDAGDGVNQFGWYDATSGGGQISSICNNNVATVTANGRQHTVMKLWSNSQGACTTSSGRVIVNATAGAFGSITPSGLQTVIAGQHATFSVTPDAGHQADVYSTCGGTLNGTTFITDAVTEDCDVVAAFDRVFADGFQ